MGLLDKLFGGGTKLQLKLDLEKLPPGGTLAGSVTLTGGKKPLTLTTLKVDLNAVFVESKAGSSLPSIDVRQVFSDSIANDRPLAPGQTYKFEFQHKLPDDLNPKASYKVKATADIPGVKDPSAEANLTILGREPSLFSAVKSRLGGAASEDEVLTQFPGLSSRETDELTSALSDLQCAAYDRDNNFGGIHTYLMRIIETHADDWVRRSALAAWGTVLDNRAKPEHIKALETLAGRELPESVFDEVVSVAAKFAEEGGLPLVKRLVADPRPAVRKRMATSLHLEADKDLEGRRELILGLCRDPDVGVRAAAFGACAGFVEENDVVRYVVAHAAQEPSPEVQRACIGSIALAHNYGNADLVFDTFIEHARKNPDPGVRQEIAESLHWLPVDARLTQLVGMLLADQAVEVRQSISWQSCNMEDHPELKSLFVRAATEDSDAEVRANALRGLSCFMSAAEVVPFARQRLARDPNEAVFYAAVRLADNLMPNPEVVGLVREVAAGPFSRPAERARELLAEHGL